MRACVIVIVALVVGATEARGATLPPGFDESIVWRGLAAPTAVRFARDGRVFVAEKGGTVKVFDSVADITAEVVIDLANEVHSFWDRGLLGFALHPDFPSTPFVYLLYTYDAPPGRTAPYWNDRCDDATGAGCAVTSRLARLELNAQGRVQARATLLEAAFCNQFPSHSIGDLAFGPDGALYVSAGDGASFTKTDTGQYGSPPNPCGDPPDQGGALRSQDLLATGDPAGADGAILRIDPLTGAALADNPLAGHADGGERVIAFGLRNPYRMAFRPGTRELWIGDVGQGRWEEVNRITDVSDGVIENFGWPCFEGPERPSGYAGHPLCRLIDDGSAKPGTLTAPFFAYQHGRAPDPAACGTSTGSAVSGIAFYAGGGYPAAYRGALLFADHARQCIWAAQAGASGLPDPARLVTLVAGAPRPVALEIGPDGDLFYVDHGGTVRRVRYFSTNRPPMAIVRASAVSGPAPLAVMFDAGASTDPDAGDTLAFDWDLDGDGRFGDGSGRTAAFTYERPGSVLVSVRVTDGEGLAAVAQVRLDVDNTPPVARIVSPAAGARFSVGQQVEFQGEGRDSQDGALSADRFTWTLSIQHCAADGECHSHELERWAGTASGSFRWPEHDQPSYAELSLVVRDSGGLEHRVTTRLEALTVVLRIETSPPGLAVTMGIDSRPTPMSLTAAVGAELYLDVPSPQLRDGEEWIFWRWTDEPGRARRLIAPATATTYVAHFQREPRDAGERAMADAHPLHKPVDASAPPVAPAPPDAGAPPTPAPPPDANASSTPVTADAGAPPTPAAPTDAPLSADAAKPEPPGRAADASLPSSAPRSQDAGADRGATTSSLGCRVAAPGARGHAALALVFVALGAGVVRRRRQVRARTSP